LQLDGIQGVLSELHLHRLVSTVATRLGLPTSSVVVEAATGARALAGRSLEAAQVTVKIRTAAASNAIREAEVVIHKVVSYVDSGDFAEELALTGVFSGLLGVGVISTDVSADEEGAWTGTVLPPVENPTAPTEEDKVFEDAREKDEYLPDGWVVQVDLVVGVNGIDRKMRSINQPEGEPRFSNTDFGSTSAQMHLLRICDLQASEVEEALGAAVFNRLHIRQVMCFAQDFEDWLQQEQLGRYPVAGEIANPDFGSDFGRLVQAWLQTKDGKKWRHYFGFVDGELRWVRVVVRTNLGKEAPAHVQLTTMEAFEEYARFRNREAPDDTLLVVPSSDTWVLAVTEDGIMSSAVACACISLLCALLAIMMFTGSAVLAIAVSSTVFMIVACQAATMFCVLRWTFGAIEAIGLILFVGFSVDYTLHVAEAFHHAPMPKVENALHHVGWAVVSAAFTTTGSAFFLFFCTVQVFVKFGGAIILNSAWSLLFALVFFPALLTILPARYHAEAYEPCVAPGPVQVVGSRTEDEPAGVEWGAPLPERTEWGAPLPEGTEWGAPLPEGTEWGAPLPEETMETESMEESSRPSIMHAAPCSEENLRANRDSDEESTGLPSVTDSAGGIGSAAASDAPRPPASFASL
jgi:hypothetical protein